MSDHPDFCSGLEHKKTNFRPNNVIIAGNLEKYIIAIHKYFENFWRYIYIYIYLGGGGGGWIC